MTESDRKDLILFSFRHLEITDKFSIPKESNYAEALTKRLRDLSKMTFKDFISQKKTLNCHPIEWKNTTEKEGFSHLNQELRDTLAWQFSITKNKHGRIHGFFIGIIFNIVWLDVEHKLYS